MPDATQNDATQADAVVQSQADTTSQTEVTTQADVNDAAAETISLDEAKKLRSESASLRKRLKDAEAAVQKFESQNQTEAEKREAALKGAEERASRAEQALQEANGRNAVYSNAGNAIDAELLYLYVEKQGIEFGEDGKPVNVKDLIEQARKDKPSLFQRGSADGGKSGPATGYEPSPGVARIAHAYEQNEKAAKR